jgi:hypothetical protein
MTSSTYAEDGYGTFTKSCAPKDRCESLMTSNADRCKSGVKDPACTYCCSEPYCNFDTPMPYISLPSKFIVYLVV